MPTVNIYNGGSLLTSYTDPPAPIQRDTIFRTRTARYGWSSEQSMAQSRIIDVTANDLTTPNRWVGYRYKTLNTRRFTVGPGDDPIGSSGERSEFLNPSSTLLSAGSANREFLAYSVYIPSGWTYPGGGGNWFIVGQLHGPDSNVAPATNPTFALDFAGSNTSPMRIRLNLKGGDVGSAVYTYTDLGQHVYNQWIDFLFDITWGNTATGKVVVHTRLNNSGSLVQGAKVGTAASIATITGANCYTSGGTRQNHYWKIGIYRNDNASVTSNIYMGPWCRASELAVAAWGAFGRYP